MLSVSPNSIVRSSLEEMLDALRRRDENEKPKDLPPALPSRPKPNSRARLPSAKRQLPTSFESGECESTPKTSMCCIEKNEDFEEFTMNSFATKKIKEMDAEESPYVLAAATELEHEPRSKENDVLEASCPVSDHRFQVDNDEFDLDYFMKKKLSVWCRLPNQLWELGQIQSNSGEMASVMLSDASVVTVSVGDLLPADPDILEGVDDLIQLSYLNEPSVLQNIRKRYCKDIIYTNAGLVLISINPFKDVHLNEKTDSKRGRTKLLDCPHIYTIAHATYNQLLTDNINQSIIFSGESGSGKTETAKLALNYLAELGGGSRGIESQVLLTCCILEAFGNAKTSENNNSSRFGKLIEFHFCVAGKLVGAKLQTFLLEKSRVVQTAKGERSFHIFYQLCAGASSDLRDALKLKSACDYKFLSQSDCLKIHGVDDSQKFQKLLGALDTLRISKEDQEQAFKLISAVLWLGNISFLEIDNENRVEVVGDEAVANAANLMGCRAQDLITTLSTTQKFHAGEDLITNRLTIEQARDTRDALAKFMYSSLFDWLVEEINSSVAAGKHNSKRSINIVDICGFESLKNNNFEQLCKNYANERLQQHFNRHMFKLVQEEYEVDGIDWTNIGFEDNQDCLKLYERIPIGLLNILDEESYVPKATGLTFASKLNKHLKVYHSFKGERDGAFVINHYSGEVLYDSGEFLEENRDILPSIFIQLLSSSNDRITRLFTSPMLAHVETLDGLSTQLGMWTCQKKTVGIKIKDQLFRLMQQLERTKPHFVCCIKPNRNQLPGVFEKDLVKKQLKNCGILEAVRISRNGYPARISHQEFTSRYGFLLPEHNTVCDPLSTSVSILQQFNILPGMYQVGYTKFYFRAGQINSLEDIRKKFLQGTLEVQRCFRGHQSRRNLQELKGRVVILQSYVRGEMVRKQCGLLRLKRQDAIKKLDEQLMAAVQIQSAFRGWFVRKSIIPHYSLEQSNFGKQRLGGRILEVKGLVVDILPSDVEELQKQVILTKEIIGQKEKENDVLKEQLQQLEARWFEYETKMKSMEEMWQSHMTSLQVNLAAAKRRSANDNAARIPRKLEDHFNDSEEVFLGSQTQATVIMTNNGIVCGAVRDTNGGLNTLTPLAKEFERKTQNFDNEAFAIVEAKSVNSHPVNPAEELQRLKNKFRSWKRDYKARLREAKEKVHSLGQAEVEKNKWKWWGKRIF